MKKLKLQVQISVDGFVGGPNGEMDFMELNWGDDIGQSIQALTDSVDTIVLGQNLAQGFIPHWANVAADPDNPEQASGKQFTDMHKVVFTNNANIDSSDWPNTILAKGDQLVDEINRLKNKQGKDIIAYGGSGFVASLIEQDLIDEYYLFINPSAIGNGMPIFNKIPATKKLHLLEVTRFECGIVLLRYAHRS